MAASWQEWLRSRNRRRSEGLLAELEVLLAVGVAEGKGQEDARVKRLFAGAGCEDYWPGWGSLFGGSVRWHLALSVCRYYWIVLGSASGRYYWIVLVVVNAG